MDGEELVTYVPDMRIFFFNDTATTEIYTLSLHDALPIYDEEDDAREADDSFISGDVFITRERADDLSAHGTDIIIDEVKPRRSEEHTSELQSRQYLVCRLLLEKKKTIHHSIID